MGSRLIISPHFHEYFDWETWQGVAVVALRYHSGVREILRAYLGYLLMTFANQHNFTFDTIACKAGQVPGHISMLPAFSCPDGECKDKSTLVSLNRLSHFISARSTFTFVAHKPETSCLSPCISQPYGPQLFYSLGFKKSFCWIPREEKWKKLEQGIREP